MAGMDHYKPPGNQARYKHAKHASPRTKCCCVVAHIRQAELGRYGDVECVAVSVQHYYLWVWLFLSLYIFSGCMSVHDCVVLRTGCCTQTRVVRCNAGALVLGSRQRAVPGEPDVRHFVDARAKRRSPPASKPANSKGEPPASKPANSKGQCDDSATT